MTAAASPFRYFPVHVEKTERVTPSMIRVTFTGPGLAGMASAGRDQRVKLFLPRPGQDAPVVPDPAEPEWYAAWRALDPSVRGVMRTFTIRSLGGSPRRLVIDFAFHGDLGPASSWASNAEPGSEIGVLAPVREENGGYDFRPPPETDWYLLSGDESALPALTAIIESLPKEATVRAWIELSDPAGRLRLPTGPGAEINWLVHGEDDPAPAAIRSASLPEGTPYAWVAGESATVKEVRRHLVRERGMDRRAVYFAGYWRRGTSEDHLMATGEAA
ncbi:siderophore-interacting protein [Streptomyces tsukubensis]|uniref:NADPH-dependent ferric siderophore reductase n=1 Tax=Streptomyces tsukubensis TaxID=83656 RepID=A0A1V4AFF0_9ACTN|nr:siderophore-interacting protein [Streptomyces tsukubensis]OON82396.1 NADPH-dependent ferric siderophore reductase [Streptomyces tsukubensis]QFR92896.1 siderophore-interacting protein [Streptomyces tsukubensis]